jgi:hypothetical protein
VEISEAPSTQYRRGCGKNKKPGSDWILTAIFVQDHDQSIDYEE